MNVGVMEGRSASSCLYACANLIYFADGYHQPNGCSVRGCLAESSMLVWDARALFAVDAYRSIGDYEEGRTIVKLVYTMVDLQSCTHSSTAKRVMGFQAESLQQALMSFLNSDPRNIFPAGKTLLWVA